MASRLPPAMSLSRFMLRAHVLRLYKDMLRIVRKIPDKKQQKDLIDFIRHDFNSNQHIEDEEAIKMMITRGKKSLRELEQTVAML